MSKTPILATSYASPSSYTVRKEVQLQPDMPGIIIFVHGVNSEGEWYEAAETHLVQGLNRRLGRTDLKPRVWDHDNSMANSESSCTSPVIHFFWGYRAKDGDERRWRVPLRDRHRNSAWNAGYRPVAPIHWGGGAFQNGCNSLPLVWSDEGFKRRIWLGFIPVDVQSLNPEVDRQLQDAPPRTYYAHAAGRLAKLMRIIRGRYPADTVTLIGHSQGVQIVLAAMSLLEAENQPDCVMLMNGPYALESKVTDALAQGNNAPSTGARRRTFENIVRHFQAGYRPITDELLARLRVGVMPDGTPWTPRKSPERDNTGRIYVYFNPHDRVMGSTALQSIGWQGLPTDLLTAFPGTLYQRMLARTTECGGKPGWHYLWPRELDGSRKPFWNRMKTTKGVLRKELWETPEPERKVMINAEEVPDRIIPEELIGFDAPSDGQRRWEQHPDFPFFRDIYEREAWIQESHPYGEPPNWRLETQAEMESRIGAYIPEPTDHSSLPSHQQFLTRVIAYDLPIGPCQSHDDPEFWHELNRLADWRLSDPYFFRGELAIPPMPALIDCETAADILRQHQDSLALWGQVDGLRSA